MDTSQTLNSETNQSQQQFDNKPARKTNLDHFEQAIELFSTASGSMPEDAPRVLQHKGLAVVISGTQGGKTSLVRNLCADYGGMFLELQEPVVNAARTVEELSLFIDAQIAKDPSRKYSFLAIDSLRMLQFEAPGNARKGGISSGFYRLLTDLTISALRSGVTIVCTLNPLASDDAVAAENAMTDVESSVTSVISGNYTRWEYISRSENKRIYSALGYLAPRSGDNTEESDIQLRYSEISSTSTLGSTVNSLVSPRNHGVATGSFEVKNSTVATETVIDDEFNSDALTSTNSFK